MSVASAHAQLSEVLVGSCDIGDCVRFRGSNAGYTPKYNQLPRIEEELSDAAVYRGKDAFYSIG